MKDLEDRDLEQFFERLAQNLGSVEKRRQFADELR